MLRRALESLALGRAGEQLAERYLKDRGLILVERNYRCGQGEIDLVMRDGDCLAFVEVKRRSSTQFGTALEMVTRSKQRKLTATARHYVAHHHLTEHQALRFDVVSITSSGKDDLIEWIPNAFYHT